MAKAPSLEQRKSEYIKQWSTMKVRPERVVAVDAAARKLLANKSRYLAVARQVGKTMPWFVIAAIHDREALKDKSGFPSFNSVLHNGQKIIGTGKKTTLVPKGRGPFSSWEDAAFDALMMPPHALQNVPSWPIERICYELEKWNGWGYWYRGDRSSAYLWAGTNIDNGGKFVADGVWSASAQDQQQGAMAIIKRLSELDPSVAQAISSGAAPVAAPTTPSTAPTPGTSVDPYGATGSVLKAIFNFIQSILKRKS